MKGVCHPSHPILHGKWKAVFFTLCHDSCSRPVLWDVLGEGHAKVMEKQQVTLTLSYVLKEIFITQMQWRDTGDFWLWTADLAPQEVKRTHPHTEYKLFMNLGMKGMWMGFRNIKCLMLSLCQGETLSSSWKSEQKENAFSKTKQKNKKQPTQQTKKKPTKNTTFVFSMTRLIQNYFSSFSPCQSSPYRQTSWNLNTVELDLKNKECLKWETEMFKMYILIFHDVEPF